MPEFRWGVKEEADKLMAGGVDPGSPVDDEFWFHPELAVQHTTTGQFWVRKIGGNFYVQFHPAAKLPLA